MPYVSVRSSPATVSLDTVAFTDSRSGRRYAVPWDALKALMILFVDAYQRQPSRDELFTFALSTGTYTKIR